MRILIISLLLIVTGQAPAGENQITRKTLVVGSQPDYPPFVTGDTEETASGFAVELWKAVAAEKNIDYTLRIRPLSQLIEEFQKGQIDALINFTDSKERRLYADFTVSTNIDKFTGFVRNGQAAIHSIADLSGKSIIVLDGGLAQEWAMSKGWQQQLVPVKTAAQGLQILAAGQHDIMLTGKLPGMQIINKLELQNIQTLDIELGIPLKDAIAVQINNPDLLAEINDGLALIKANGRYDLLFEQWLGIYEESDALNHILRRYSAPLALILAVILGSAYYKWHADRRLSQRQILAIQQRTQLALDGGDLGMWDWDVPSGKVFFNERWCGMLGYRQDEVEPHYSSKEKLIHPDDWAHINPVLNDHLAGKIPRYEAEHRMLHKNGQWIWVLNRGKVMERGSNGKPLRVVGTHHDISDRKNQEQRRIEQEKAHRNTLVREVHHRIKNNIQGITGILRQYPLTHPETLAPINQAVSQMHSIAVLYGLQGQDSLSRVHLSELLGAIVNEIGTLWKMPLKLDKAADWPGFIITENEAVPIALILNELAMNAVKHGNNSGYAEISLRTGDSDGSVQIAIHNHGALPPGFNFKEQTRINTGLNLVASLLPPVGAKLTIEQQGPVVIALLELHPPVLAKVT
jgi:PAS domain S-box-containing protein